MKQQLIKKYKSILAQLNLNETIEDIAGLCANKEDELLNSLPFQSTNKISSYIIEDAIKTLANKKVAI